MAHYILIPGAGGTAWLWHRVIPLLEAKGHHATAVDLPGDDERAGLPVYTEPCLPRSATPIRSLSRTRSAASRVQWSLRADRSLL